MAISSWNEDYTSSWIPDPIVRTVGAALPIGKSPIPTSGQLWPRGGQT